METITIHWGFAFALPLAGAFIARLNHNRWQAWVVAAVMSLIGVLMIVLVGRGTPDYTLAVLIITWVVGAFLPDIWHWTRGFVQRRAGWFIGAGMVLGLAVYNPGLLYYVACLGLVFGAVYLMLRPFLGRGR